MDKPSPITPKQRVEHVLQAQAEMRSLQREGLSPYMSPTFEQVYRENFGLIGHTVVKYYHSVFTYVQFDELASVGIKAAEKAILGYDPEKGEFSTYFTQHLRSRLPGEASFYRRMPHVPEDARDIVSRTQRKLERWGLSADTLRNVREANPELDEEHAQWIVNAYWAGEDRTLPDYDQPGDEASEELPYQLVDDGHEAFIDTALDVDAMLTSSEMAELRRRLVMLEELKPKLHGVIVRRFLYPMDAGRPTLQAVGESIGSLKQRVQQMEQEGLMLLRNPQTLEADLAKKRARKSRKPKNP